MRLLSVVVLLLCAALPSRAGGPAFVAGSGFNSQVQGQPVTWAGGNVTYFTDQGDLSPLLTNAQADVFVASTFSSWTAISGVALAVAQGGHLAEDVNGTNVIGYPNGTYSIPADIQPTALTTPVGIVYDYDGQVTEALLGVGAGGLDDCFTNAVYGGPDNFSSGGSIIHALVVINGVCAATTSQLPDVQYRLTRILGRVLGLDWSQANLNVITGNPPPTAGDFEGFPLMHFLDPVNCVPISRCYPDAAVPKMDDRSELRRLYPAAAQPQTASIQGNVYFTNAAGNLAQPMQGVNVVARLIDGNGNPSRQFVATSISGFAFVGDAGNAVNGYVDTNGQRYDFFGSTNPALEGAFNLAGVEIPAGQNSAQYQLSVEALDPNWSQGVGPYAPWQVAPSGRFTPVIVTVQAESNVPQDVLMRQSAQAQAGPGSGGTYANPAPLPLGGAWGTWLSGYGDASWFQFTVQANRTASVTTIAVDESGQPTEAKAMPVIGIWPLSDQSGGLAWSATPSAFNTLTWGVTRLDAQFSSAGTMRLGLADSRGDGRPDYFYYGSLLYSDSVTPARISLAGGVAALDGLGFHPGLQVAVGSGNGTVLSASATQLQVALPAGAQDGTASIQVNDATTSGFSQMIDALTYGAAATDLLLPVLVTVPSTPVGAQSANPVRVRAVAADGITPVGGATVAWSANNGALLSACSGATSCSVLTDASGLSSTLITPMATGTSTLTAALAPASYSPPQSQQAAVVATSSSLDLAAVLPTRWIAQGATLSVPLTAQVLSMGLPQANVKLNFAVVKGAATLSAATATTDNSGHATVNANITNQAADVRVTACVAPNNAPCQTFTMFSTPPSLWTLQTVSGSAQIVPAGQAFQPLVMRITDGSSAANPVTGATVAFQTTLERIPPNPTPGGDDGGNGGGTPMPVILGTSATQVLTTQDGLASLTPTGGTASAPLDVMIAASAANSAAQFHLQMVPPMGGGQENQPAPSAPATPHGQRWMLPSPVAPGVSHSLFAVPEGLAIDEASGDVGPHDPAEEGASESRPCGDSNANPCSGSSSEIVKPEIVKPGIVKTKVAKAKAIKPGIVKPKRPKPGRVKAEAARLGTAESKTAIAPPSSYANEKGSEGYSTTSSPAEGGTSVSRQLLEDKRSCRFAVEGNFGLP